MWKITPLSMHRDVLCTSWVTSCIVGTPKVKGWLPRDAQCLSHHTGHGSTLILRLPVTILDIDPSDVLVSHCLVSKEDTCQSWIDPSGSASVAVRYFQWQPLSAVDWIRSLVLCGQVSSSQDQEMWWCPLGLAFPNRLHRMMGVEAAIYWRRFVMPLVSWILGKPLPSTWHQFMSYPWLGIMESFIPGIKTWPFD
jgi:hypothetical protein